MFQHLEYAIDLPRAAREASSELQSAYAVLHRNANFCIHKHVVLV